MIGGGDATPALRLSVFAELEQHLNCASHESSRLVIECAAVARRQAAQANTPARVPRVEAAHTHALAAHRDAIARRLDRAALAA